MSYPGPGEVSAILRRPAAVETVLVRTTTARFIAPGSLTGGRFGLFQWDMPGGAGGATPHFHRTFSESFYVISGTVELFDGSGWARAGSGDFLYVPEGGVHGFRNAGAAPASMLILFAPGAPRERYFIELADALASGRRTAGEEWTAFLASHDQYAAEE